ncbi:MAG: 4'-phosphopantetheinyl transferase family protein [Rhabdaerophilum sp.]|jgi:phosphopantetheinyl transferase|nr:4'-phosphopantetheinyl transferase superfamily protein [Hyphomicrobiales bacterium]
MSASLPKLPHDALRHGEAETPASLGTPLADLGQRLQNTGFIWFFADLTHLPPALCPAMPEEEEQARMLPAGLARDGWLARRRLARQVVAEARGVNPADVGVATDVRGRPVLERAGLGFHVSFAAREALALIGIADRPIGIDLEIEVPDLVIPLNVLREDERAWLAAQPEALRACGFLRIWTAKEAIVKAVGQGFRLAPEQIILPALSGGDVDIRNLANSGEEMADYPGQSRLSILTREALRVFVSRPDGHKRGETRGVIVAVARSTAPGLADPPG